MLLIWGSNPYGGFGGLSAPLTSASHARPRADTLVLMCYSRTLSCRWERDGPSSPQRCFVSSAGGMVSSALGRAAELSIRAGILGGPRRKGSRGLWCATSSGRHLKGGELPLGAER